MTKMIADFSGIFIICELDKAPCHGYLLRKNIKAMTGTLPNIGQIYPTLYRYEELGLLKSHKEKNWRNQTIRVYELTDKGKATTQLIKMALTKLTRPVPDSMLKTHGF